MMISNFLIVLCCASAPAASGFAPLGIRPSSTRSLAREEEEAPGPACDDDDSVVRRGGRRRRDILGAVISSVLPAASACSSFPSPSLAASARLRPDDAFASLVAARGELRYAAENFLPRSDWDGMRTYLDERAVNMNNYESSAGALLESKRLDAESKRDIGTIRRYGVGADVIIMYGGLKSELRGRGDDENEEEDEEEVGGGGRGGGGTSGVEVAKYLRRTADSLDEVLSICRNNGFT